MLERLVKTSTLKIATSLALSALLLSAAPPADTSCDKAEHYYKLGKNSEDAADYGVAAAYYQQSAEGHGECLLAMPQTSDTQRGIYDLRLSSKALALINEAEMLHHFDPQRAVTVALNAKRFLAQLLASRALTDFGKRALTSDQDLLDVLLLGWKFDAIYDAGPH
jgi:hypothetical protein